MECETDLERGKLILINVNTLLIMVGNKIGAKLFLASSITKSRHSTALSRCLPTDQTQELMPRKAAKILSLCI